MTKVVISQNNGEAPFWHVVNFLGAGKCEPRGIVDLLAVRKNQANASLPLKRGDLFEMVLIQVKGGSAKRPSVEERARLREVAKCYGARTVLLSEWRKGSRAVFRRLDGDEWSDAIDPGLIFGKRQRLTTGKHSATHAKQSAKSLAAHKAWATRRAGFAADA